ncbi:uncharacterized protein METZ01_LOCUS481915 [marine metagenome]|uniref:Uncharacterized protein n=1 Tax=marine metagenome TaxID=408172 RepID=A0A383CA70_9ZZZZ
MNDLDKKWSQLLEKLENQFDQEMTLKGVLYLIGVQELNLGIKQYEREEKVNVLHVAICKILTPFGFYKFDRIDEDGWPHYIELKAIKNLSESQQELLMKEAIITYLN